MPVVFPLSGRAVPRKPLLFWFLRNPLGQPPVAQCRRTGEIQPKLTREGHLANFEGRYLPCSTLHFKRQWSALETTRTITTRRSVNIMIIWLLRVWSYISSASPPMIFPHGDPNIPRNFWTTSPAIPDLTTTVSSQQLSLFVVAFVVLVSLYQ